MRRIGGYVCPGTKKSIFFTISICLVALCLFFSVGVKPTVNLADGKVKLPIIMYHSVLDSTARQGKYVITPAVLEADFQYLKKNGYTTVTTADLIAFRDGKADLPQKPIMITFDDGYYNNYSYLFPLLQKYEVKAVLSVIGRYVDEYSKEGEVMNNNYSHATWTQLKEMQDSGCIELQNHSYDMHDWTDRKGVLRKSGEDAAHYKELLTGDIMKMQEKLKQYTGAAATAFIYPFGAVNKESRAIVESIGFSVTYGCEEGINEVDKDSDLKELKRYNRPGNMTTEEFFKKIF